MKKDANLRLKREVGSVVLFTAIFFAVSPANAGPVTKPHADFVAKTPILASQVNDNFNSLFSGLANFGGDITGNSNDTILSKIQGIAVSAGAPVTGDFLGFDGSAWVPTSMSGGSWLPLAGGTLSGSLGVVGVLTSPGSGVQSEKFGLGASATGTGSAAFGKDASASAINASAMGKSSSVQGVDAVAVGANTSVVPSGASGIALGKSASVSSVAGISIGAGSEVSGAHSIALGAGATSSGSNSIALGMNASSTLSNTLVVGGQVPHQIEKVIVGQGEVGATTLGVVIQSSNTAGVSAGSLTIAGGDAPANFYGGSVVIAGGNGNAGVAGAVGYGGKVVIKTQNKDSGAQVDRVVVNGRNASTEDGQIASVTVEGVMKLKLLSAAPFTCTPSDYGTMAMNSSGTLCFCRNYSGSAWVDISGGALCSW